ncbi:esterase-like activity of phytase family protein [Desulfovibrio inopinatus]|uniref:esterase-like activity of phytase family protein n=1 Tax=Desulfovibrio inopinatus TaxID=102109 RepID=UPI0003F803F4|nr:esterase-like activity of phytase family protein [Desulfovibrio inopinatus]
MNIRVLMSLGVAALSLGMISPSFAAEPTIKKYDIVIDESLFVPYDGAAKHDFPKGFPVGVGSSMYYVGKDEDGALLFSLISDRGPNADSPAYKADDDAKPVKTKMFPAPQFNPGFGIVKVTADKAELVDFTTLKSAPEKPITGLPIPQGAIGSTGETPLSDSLTILPYDKNGMDTEGIEADSDGNLWVCDEYGPFIAKLDPKTGVILEKYGPGEGLPEIVKFRQPNRGFEGLTITPSGKIIAAVQSILDVDGKVKKSNAQFIRFVELDPKTGKTRMFAYPHDVDAFKKSRDAKIGDLAAVSDDKLLVVEQGKGKDKKMRNLIYMVDLSKATDLTGKTASDGKPLETIDTAEELSKAGVVPMSKTFVFDLKAHGWKPSKAEGIALLDDGKTLAVASDNDFGMTLDVENPAKDKDGKDVKKPTGYVVDSKGTITYEKEHTNTTFHVKPTGERSQIWLITLPEPIK